MDDSFWSAPTFRDRDHALAWLDSALTFGNLSTVYDVPMAAGNAAGCMAVKTACPGYSLPYIN